MRALLLTLGARHWAVDLASVREVIELPHLCRVPSRRPSGCSVFNLRGELVAAFELAGLLGERAEAPRWCTVVESVSGVAGLLSAGCPSMEELGEPVGEAEHRCGLARFLVAGRPIAQLDLDALLAPDGAIAAAP